MVSIRKAKIEDVEQIKQLLLDNVEFQKDYLLSKLQKEALNKYFSEHKILSLVEGINVFVAEDDVRDDADKILNNELEIIGVFAVEENLLFSLYTKKSENFVNIEIGKEMLDYAEIVIQEKGFDEVNALALEPLKRFFEKNKYKEAEKWILEFDGVKFNEFRLTKSLI